MRSLSWHIVAPDGAVSQELTVIENLPYVLERLRRGLVSLERCTVDDSGRSSVTDINGIIWDRDFEMGFLAFYQGLEALKDEPNAMGLDGVRRLLAPLRVFYSHPPDIRSQVSESDLRIVNPHDDGSGVREVRIHINLISQTAYAHHGKSKVNSIPSKQSLIDSTQKLIHYLEEGYEKGRKIVADAYIEGRR